MLAPFLALGSLPYTTRLALTPNMGLKVFAEALNYGSVVPTSRPQLAPASEYSQMVLLGLERQNGLEHPFAVTLQAWLKMVLEEAYKADTSHYDRKVFLELLFRHTFF